MKVLITGANGMLARAAVAHCLAIGDEVLAMTREELDISDSAQVGSVFERHKPDGVLNCAAYTDVDGAETNEQAAYKANAIGVENLATASRRSHSRFLTVSTDYVFDGSKSGFYTQRDTPAPRGVYATSKLEGERRAVTANAGSIIVRSGWIYGEHGTNFLSVIPRLLAEGKRIKAISDSFGTPTYAADLARRLRELVELDLPCIFHVTNAGPGASYLEFARAVCETCGFDEHLIEPVGEDQLERPAPRPVSSRLACLFSERLGLAPLPNWKDSLRKFVQRANYPTVR